MWPCGCQVVCAALSLLREQERSSSSVFFSFQKQALEGLMFKYIFIGFNMFLIFLIINVLNLVS